MSIHLLGSGAGTVPVDSGLPHLGRLLAVASDGDLRWYQYRGQGEEDRSGTKGWVPGSGNAIGNGWGGFQHLLGCGDGIVLAIQPDGALLWYRYDGDGSADRSGATGWHPNSGNQIGRGWAGFRHVFVVPQEGRSTGSTATFTVFGVAQNGDLHWYRYDGNGEQDPTGALGWRANSGNVVGNGWTSFQQVVGSGAGIFGIQPDGALRWYRYGGDGTADRSGSTGWHPSSGNHIGRGWADFPHVAAVTTDRPTFGTAVFAVRPDGDLLWYHYAGHGEPDPTGAAGWSPSSGHAVGNGF